MHDVSKRKRRVVLAEQFFFPEGWSGAQIPRDISIDLTLAGFDVEVVCGRDQYVPTEYRQDEDPTLSGVRIRRIPRLINSEDIQVKKLLRHVWFYVTALPLLLFRRKPDVFIGQTNPPLIVVLVCIAALFHRRPFVLIAMDLYPEVLFAHKLIREQTVLGRTLTRLFSWTYRRAAKVVALGSTMQRRLEAKGVPPDRIVVISNWATGGETVVRGEQNKLLKEWRLHGCKVILYSGNLGVAHDVETPIRAFKIARERCPQLRLVFVSKGTRLEYAKCLAEECGLKEFVSFHSLVPAARLSESLGIADLALVTLRPGFEGLVVPSKLLGYMARGIPTIYIGPPSDAQTLLKKSGGGVSFNNDEVAAIAEFMISGAKDPESLESMRDAASHYYTENLSRNSGLKKYRQLIEDVCVSNAAMQSG